MKARAIAAVAVQLIAGVILSSAAGAIEPEKQPIYSNTPAGLLCGTTQPGSPPVPIPCTVPAGQRLIIEHVSGYAFLPNSTSSTIAVVIVITDPALGLNGGAFHTFVATKTDTSGGTDVFSFSIPFRMMLNPGATFFFSPAVNVAVSGYLVKQ